ncbi:hypothetical protein [Algoriphagus namhaensis]
MFSFSQLRSSVSGLLAAPPKVKPELQILDHFGQPSSTPSVWAGVFQPAD